MSATKKLYRVELVNEFGVIEWFQEYNTLHYVMTKAVTLYGSIAELPSVNGTIITMKRLYNDKTIKK